MPIRKQTVDLLVWGTGQWGKLDHRAGATSRQKASRQSQQLSSLYDLSADYGVSKQITLPAYDAHAFGKVVVAALCPLTVSRTMEYRTELQT